MNDAIGQVAKTRSASGSPGLAPILRDAGHRSQPVRWLGWSTGGTTARCPSLPSRSARPRDELRRSASALVEVSSGFELFPSAPCDLKQRLEGRITTKRFECRIVARKKRIIDEPPVNRDLQPPDCRLPDARQGKALREKAWKYVSCARDSLDLWSQLCLRFTGICQRLRLPERTTAALVASHADLVGKPSAARLPRRVGD